MVRVAIPHITGNATREFVAAAFLGTLRATSSYTAYPSIPIAVSVKRGLFDGMTADQLCHPSHMRLLEVVKIDRKTLP